MATKKQLSNQKSSQTRLIFLTGIAVFLAIVLLLMSAGGFFDTSNTRGILDASVIYEGQICPDKSKIQRTPPCTGPYSDFLVRIFDAKTNMVKAAFLTDELGKVLINLQVGDYYWLGRGKIDGEIERVDFTIRPGVRTYKNFVIKQTSAN